VSKPYVYQACLDIILVGWDTILQADRPWLRFPERSVDFLIDLTLQPSMHLGSTQPLTEMSTRNLPRAERGRFVRLTTSPLWAGCFENVEASKSHKPMDLHIQLNGCLLVRGCIMNLRLRNVHKDITCYCSSNGTTGRVVVKALSYKRVRDPMRWIFSICLILSAALGPGVYSAPNGNEYLKHKNNNNSGE
jgi:hypothetical protein